MTDSDIAHALQRFPTGALCNAHSGVKALDSSIAPLYDGARLCGPAKTARISPGQNAGIHRTAHRAAPGEVLVVDGGAAKTFGPFGDILATFCRRKKIAGLVISSTIRDTAEIRQMQFPVFCMGANPTATAKMDPGEIDVAIMCGGVLIRPGDFVVGDDDGVVVLSREIASEVVNLAEGVLRKEEDILKQIAAGATTCEIFGLTP
jgi:4-hydroxy-4-methyl-2-oxoglutarate aldolase